tara:strand:- start:7169 stop:7705 length:537 start_codon:yes stop_codon:yes gene_type:complete
MKEIEVKAKVKDKELILSKLKEMNIELQDPITQKDIVFIPKQFEGKPPLGTNVLRIRDQDGKLTFTLKQPQKNELDCIEKEITLDNAQQMHDIIIMLGFKVYAEFSKTRRKAKYNGLEICLDEVSGLGSFIEVERLAEEGDAEKIQEELFAFLMKLGVSKEDQVMKGYDTLVYLKNNG